MTNPQKPTVASFELPIREDGPAEKVVVMQNISFDAQGRVYRLTKGRVRRWWQTRQGWTHYVGEHTRPR